MSKVLVKYDTNWADEMDIEGFTIVSEKEWNEFKTFLGTVKTSFSICFGTNEDNEYQNGKALLAELTAKKITPEEEKVIKKFIGKEYGHSDFMDQVRDYISDFGIAEADEE